MCKYCNGEYRNDWIEEYNSEWQISKDSNNWCLEVEIETLGRYGYETHTALLDINFCPKCGRNLNQEVDKNE